MSSPRGNAPIWERRGKSPSFCAVSHRSPRISDPLLSYHLMDGLPAEVDWKQELLELRVERERLVRVLLHLQRLIEFMESDSGEPAPRRTVHLPRRRDEQGI